MKHFLIIWYTMVNGQAYANVTEWPTQAECEATKAEVFMDMEKGKEYGRWGSLVVEAHAVCVPAEDADRRDLRT